MSHAPHFECWELLLPQVQGVELSEMVQSVIEKVRFYAILLHDNSGGADEYKNIGKHSQGR